jgi:hypothetical protein
VRTSNEEGAEEIVSYWREAKRLSALPEFFYFIDGGVGGFRALDLHQIRCTGEILRSSMAPFKPKWVGIKEAILWQGPFYKPSPSEVPGKTYSYSKHKSFLTKKDAVDHIHVLVADYEHEAEMNLGQVEESIKKLSESRDTLKEYILSLEDFSLSVKDLK